MSLEDYDYDVPKTPLTEDLVDDIVCRLKRTNENINFLTFHITQELRNLPLRMFNNDDEDTE